MLLYNEKCWVSQVGVYLEVLDLGRFNLDDFYILLLMCIYKEYAVILTFIFVMLL